MSGIPLDLVCITGDLVAAVKPVSRDKLERLGAKLDAADKSGGDNWAGLYDDYRELVMARALAKRTPKVSFNTPGNYWTAMAMLMAVAERSRALDAQRKEATKLTMRAAADLEAAAAAALRDWQVIAEAKRANDRKQQNNKAFWRAVGAAQRARVKCGAFSFPVMVHFGRQSWETK